MNTATAYRIFEMNPQELNKESLGKRYKQLVKLCHPDNPKRIQLDITELNLARQVLLNEMEHKSEVYTDRPMIKISGADLEKVLKGMVVKTDNGVEVRKETLEVFKVMVEFEWTIQTKQFQYRFSQLHAYEPMKRYVLKCVIKREDDKNVKVDCLGKKMDFEMCFNVLEVNFSIDKVDLKLHIEREV